MRFQRLAIAILAAFGVALALYLLLPSLHLGEKLAGTSGGATPAPATPSASAEPDVPMRMAPPGYYYLIERATTTTDSGVYSFAPGTKLKLVSRSGGKLRLTDGRVEVVVDELAVTEFADIAELAQSSEADLQSKIAELRKRVKTRNSIDGSGGSADDVFRLARPGYYFLLRRVSVFTDSGVIGFPPGAELALVSRNNGKVRLTDGSVDVYIQEPEVTNDAEIAALASANYTALQRKIRTLLGSRRAMIAARELAAAERRMHLQQLQQLQKGLSRPSPAQSAAPEPSAQAAATK